MTQDTWTEEDGHYVGHDGFVVPRTTDEFYQRYPDYTMVIALKAVGPDRAADLAQDMAVKLYRNRAVEKFDPVKTHGCNASRWFFYLTMCLRRHHKSLWREGQSEPLNQGTESMGEDEFSFSEEKTHNHALTPTVVDYSADDRIYIAQFKRFIIENIRENPNSKRKVKATPERLIETLDALMVAGTPKGVAELLNTTKNETTHLMTSLRKAGEQFLLSQKRKRRPLRW